MAKLTISWTPKALQQKKDILTYWLNRNLSSTFPSKLENEIESSLLYIAVNQSIKKQLFINHYYIRVREYWIVYEIKKTLIIVLLVIDARQDPSKLPNQS
jgi:toxin YoeB